MGNVLDVLQERGFVEQTSDLEGLRQALTKPVTFYIGYDPSASSFHCGNLLTIMAAAHMQRHGHRPILLVGGGTGMIGDPSGKTEMRQLLDEERIAQHVDSLRAQLSRFIDMDRALLLNNADWLLELRYIPFLRDIGRHFSVNRMLAAEAYRARMETGLSFLEFNYQLLQAYDFLCLHRQHGCTLQMGGNDQWGNILAGVDLIRRIEGTEVYALTFPLLTTASGAKMGKSAAGAIWLDAEQYSPFDFYQYWINTHDDDVERFLRIYTFLPMEEIKELGRLRGADIRNLDLKNVQVDIDTQDNCFAAGLAGFAEDTRLSNITVSGRIHLKQSNVMTGVGGLVGFGMAEVKDCATQTELVFVDTNPDIRCEQFMGGILACGYGDVVNSSVRIRAYASVHGYVHIGGLVGMYHVHREQDQQRRGLIEGCRVHAAIDFFEKNTDRRAYCYAFTGEKLNKLVKIKNNKVLRFRDKEHKRYDKPLLPEKDANPVYTAVLTPPTATEWGFTTYTCDQCNYSYTDHYKAPGL